MRVFVVAGVFGFCANLGFSAKVLQYDLFTETQASRATRQRSVVERSGDNNTISQLLLNNFEDFNYYITVQVGTPPQKINLNIATGSQNTVLVAKDGACSEWAVCETPFIQEASSTYGLLGKDEFKIVYVTGTATGDYISEDFILGSSNSPVKLFVGLVDTFDSLFSRSGSGAGVLGLGYLHDPNLSSGVNDDNGQMIVHNIVDQLVAHNIINTRLYSLWLNSQESPAGNVLFGGVDTSKFLGNLTSVPLRKEFGGYSSSTISLVSLSIADGGPESAFDLSLGESMLPIALDSGTSWILLPSVAVQKIYSMLGVVMKNQDPLVDCKIRLKTDSFLTFGFENGQKIKVDYSQLIGEAKYAGTSYTDLPFDEPCMLGIYSNDIAQGYSILGHPFLRSAYVVYDVDNNRVGIAQTNLAASAPDVHEIVTGVNNIPRVSLGPARSSTISNTKTSLGSATETSGAAANVADPTFTRDAHVPKTSTMAPSATASDAAVNSNSQRLRSSVALVFTAVIGVTLYFSLQE